MSRIVDLTWPIYEGMTSCTAPWHPNVEISILGRHHQEGRASRKVVLGTHTGTHMDAPLHFIQGGMSIDEVPVSKLVTEATVMDLTYKQELSKIEPSDLEPYADQVRPGDSVILNTGWWRQWDKPGFYGSYPCLTAASCQWLIESRVSVVGMDIPGPDDPTAGIVAGEISPRHVELLGNGVIMIEYLANLDQISKDRVTLVALPMKIRGGDGAPARVIVIED